MQFLKRYWFLFLAVILSVTVLTAGASKSVTWLDQVMAPVSEPYTIVIDPGHGGEDGGAVSCTGVTESTINLSISQRLEELLLFMGQQTKMTRAEDISLHNPDAETVSEMKVSDLKNRVRIVNETNRPVLISIHQNMFSEERYYGAQVFYADTEGSLPLAELLQGIFRSDLDPSNHREVKKSLTVYLMNKIQCPGVLIECGFLSNRQEEAKLRDDAYQKQLVCAITAGLMQFLTDQAPVA